jgi:hypothetical protein
VLSWQASDQTGDSERLESVQQFAITPRGLEITLRIARSPRNYDDEVRARHVKVIIKAPILMWALYEFWHRHMPAWLKMPPPEREGERERLEREVESLIAQGT